MKSAAFLIMIVCGCSDPSSGVNPGPTTSELAARLSVVEQENRAMRLALGASTMLGDPVMAERIARLEARVAGEGGGKQLHLVVRETGEDLGVSVDGALAAWNEKAGAIINYGPPRASYFSTADCKGDPYLASPDVNRLTQYVFIGDGRAVRPISSAPTPLSPRFVLTEERACVATNDGPAVRGIAATFAVTPYTPESLDVQLR